jgi:hypothetical protein
MVLCGKIWRGQFPLFSAMGRCRRLSFHFRECMFGVGRVLVKDLSVLLVHAILLHKYMYFMDS